MKKLLTLCFRPLSGLSLFLRNENISAYYWSKYVSVPSRGYLFFYLDSCRIRKRWIWFPSPLGVISFFTKKGKPQRTEKTARFRPLSGLSLFLRKSCRLWNRRNYGVSVPSRGYLFFYDLCCKEPLPEKCFRPLSGLSLFLHMLLYMTSYG